MPFPTLLAQAGATFAASFAVGYLPVVFSGLLDRAGKGGGRALKAVEVIGMGVLVGSALTIIIPEGVSTLYDALPPGTKEDAHPTRWVGCSLVAGFALMLLVESLTPHPGHQLHDEHHDYAQLASHDHHGSSHAHDFAEPRAISPTHPASRDSTSSTAVFDAEQEEQQGGPGKGRFALKKTAAGAGAIGFSKDRPAGWDEEQGRRVKREDLWMTRDAEDTTTTTTTVGRPFAGTAQGYVKSVPSPIDATSTHASGGNGLPGQPRMNSRTALFPTRTPTTTTRRHRDSNASETADRCPQVTEGSQGGVAGLNATLGLVIHAMADGVALGASSLSGSEGLGLVVFLAVIVHKGPTALGLTTTLLSLGLTRPQIRTRLFLFSIAAPLGAVITYMVVKAVGAGKGGTQRDDEVDAIGWWTGVVLLFSGGSFLYVATVISPLSDADAHDMHQHAHQGKHDEADGQALGKKTRLALLLAGMGGPLLLSMSIGHAH